jgi:DNA-binding transcriptional MerR regulator
MMAIGELAERTGVAATALRYYDDLGLVRPSARVGGQRRYDESAVKAVGVVLFLRDVGFTLEEIRSMVVGSSSWRSMARSKLAELDEAAANIAAARVAIQHALRCPEPSPATCSRFWSIVEERVEAQR